MNRGVHRLSGELGTVQQVKSGGAPNVSFGLGYAYRPVKGFEVGAALRYFLTPAHEPRDATAQPAAQPGEPSQAPARYVDPAFHDWFFGPTVRGFVTFGAADRFELGLTLRAGILARSTKPGVCCAEVAVAPGLRVRIARSSAIELAPELAVGTTGADPNQEDTPDFIYARTAVWVSFVQTL
ncbi:MAG: hypothetical protein ABI488_27390 [Polyangiaceae bacterium]